MQTKCSNIFGHRFPDVEVRGSLFKRVDCTRKHCDYAMDAVAFKKVLDSLPEGNFRKHMERVGPRILD